MTEWTDSKKWPDADRLAEMLAALERSKPRSPEVIAEALPEIVAVLKVQGMGIAAVYTAAARDGVVVERQPTQFPEDDQIFAVLTSGITVGPQY